MMCLLGCKWQKANLNVYNYHLHNEKEKNAN